MGGIRPKRVAAGFDLGGTALKSGLVDSSGGVFDIEAAPVEAARGLAGIRDGIQRAAARLRAAARERRMTVARAGVGVAGTLSGPRGRIVTPSPALPFTKGFEIAACVRRAMGVPSFAENDATVAALAEFRFGSGAGSDSLLMATVGTGLGGGLVLDGELVRGRHGTAGEIGHGVFQPDGESCGCGSRGCLEQYVASRALKRFFREAGGDSGAPVRTVIGLALDGEPRALAAVTRIGRNLGIGLATCASLVPVDVIAIGGGVSVLGRVLIAPVRAAFREHALPEVRRGVRIVRARLGNDAGLIGAATLALGAGS